MARDRHRYFRPLPPHAQRPEHTIRIEVGGRPPWVPVRFGFAPFSIKAGTTARRKGSRSADPRSGEGRSRRNVFARAGGEEFAFSSDHDKPITKTVKLTRPDAGGPLELAMYNRNPGLPNGSYDDNPAFNRGFTL